MIEGKSPEWPLVIFTVGLELCCGITIVTATQDLLGSASTGSVRWLGLSILPLTFAAILASTFHLGRPFSFWRAFINFCQSRLSTEIVLTTLFGALAFVHAPMWFGAVPKQGLRLGSRLLRQAFWL
jgi:DMSO reductase anchor subunit